jgi:hypothetical protein
MRGQYLLEQTFLLPEAMSHPQLSPLRVLETSAKPLVAQRVAPGVATGQRIIAPA